MSNIAEEGRRQVAGWNEAQLAEANAYLSPAQAVDGLFLELGKQTLGPGAMRDDLAAAGKAIFRNMHGSLRSILCRDERLRAYADPSNAHAADGLGLLAVIASLIASVSVGLNSMLVAALVLRIGLRNICEGVW